MSSARVSWSAGWKSAPGVPWTQWSGQRVCDAVGEFDLLEWLFAGVDGGEGIVVGGVPVLGEDDVLEVSRGAVDRVR